MRQHKGKLVILLAVISVNIVAGRWLKIYDENYHRPTYYNRAHRSSNHIDYNREALERRDYRAPPEKPTLPPFDPKTHHSFYVNVLYKGSVICAGALISRRMILTSSRCFLANEREPSHEFKARDMTILTGNHFGKKARHVYPVRAFFLPAGAYKYEDVHRVALLALYDKLPKGTYRYIGLYRTIPAIGENVTMSYVDSYSRDITLAKTKVVPRSVCRASYYKINKVQMPIDRDMFCVKNKRKGGCSTRPGDPLIIRNALAGINIYGEHCDELEGSEIVDVYYTTHYSVRFIQDATDMYRALTGTAYFNSSITTKRHQLYRHTTTRKYIPDLDLNPGPWPPMYPPGTQATQGWHTTSAAHEIDPAYTIDEPHTTEEMHISSASHTTEEMHGSSASHTTEETFESSTSNTTAEAIESSTSNTTAEANETSTSNTTAEPNETSESNLPESTTGESIVPEAETKEP